MSKFITSVNSNITINSDASYLLNDNLFINTNITASAPVPAGSNALYVNVTNYRVGHQQMGWYRNDLAYAPNHACIIDTDSNNDIDGFFIKLTTVNRLEAGPCTITGWVKIK